VETTDDRTAQTTPPRGRRTEKQDDAFIVPLAIAAVVGVIVAGLLGIVFTGGGTDPDPSHPVFQPAEQTHAAVLDVYPDATNIQYGRSGDRRYVAWNDGDLHCSAPIDNGEKFLLALPICQ
jgi:hypothetical protein